MKITLITDEENAPTDIDGEFIHFGSPSLFQIFKAVKKTGNLSACMRKSDPQELIVPLQPWLGMNVTISYQSDMKKDKLIVPWPSLNLLAS